MNDKLLNIFNDIEDFHWWFLGRRYLLEKVIKKYSPSSRKLKILDVGCGTGGNINFLSQFGKVYGIDSSPLAINYCKKHGYKNTKLSDAVKLPFKEKQFDLIFLLDVLEHIKDHKKAIKEAKRVLKDDGLIVVTAPALPFIWSKHDEMQGHYRRYKKIDFQKLAKEASLKIKGLSYFNAFLLVPIGFIRKLSVLKPFNSLGEYDSKINFDIAKATFLNKLLFNIFKTEINLSQVVEYPAGISLLGVFAKR